MLCGMDDPSLTPEPSAPFVQTKLGRALVTGGSGFVGANLVTELLERGHQVRSFDRGPYPLAAHPRLEVVQGDICDPQTVAAAVEGVDTIFHTAAIINLMGGASVTDEYRQRSFAINVNGTKNLVHAAQVAGVKRFVYTASNSVVMGGQRLSGGDETLPYTERFNDLYTETKVVAERFVLSQNGVDGLLTCSIRPSGIWGRGDQTMFRRVFESVLAGHVKVLVGSKDVKLDNSYVHNLIHAHPRRRTSGARRDRTRAGLLHQRRRADQHVRVLPARRRGVWPAMAETPSAGPAGVVRDDGVAVVSLPLRPSQAATGTPCGGTALPRQLLLDRQGAA